MTHFFHWVDFQVPSTLSMFTSFFFYCWIIFHWISLCIYPGVSIFLAIMDNAAMDKFLYGHVFISLGYLSQMWNCQHMVTMFHHLRNCQTVFHSDCAILHSHQQCMNFLFLQILDNTCYCLSFFTIAILVGCEMVSLWLIYFFWWVKMLSSFSCGLLLISLEKGLFRFFTCFQIEFSIFCDRVFRFFV